VSTAAAVGRVDGRPVTDRTELPVIIVPAHDEGATIATGMTMLLENAGPEDFRVVVVCNGCTDDTAQRARAVAANTPVPVDVLEVGVASKSAALRAAEALVLGFPRLYLDADVLCRTTTARALLAAVAQRADVAVPTRILDLADASVLARAYYLTWAQLPWVQGQLSGRGAYALSERARASFVAFPEAVADDRFATSRVTRDRAVIIEEPLVIRPPQKLLDVVRVRSRIYAGGATVDAATHDANFTERLLILFRLAALPPRWPGLVVFAVTTLAAKMLAQRAVRRDTVGWSRDTRRGIPADAELRGLGPDLAPVTVMGHVFQGSRRADAGQHR